MSKWYRWILVVIAAALSAAVYHRLPDELPIHWDAAGNVNGSTDRFIGALLVPAIMLVMSVALNWLPTIDPKRENYAKFRPTYDFVINAVITAMLVIHVAVLGTGLGWPISMRRVGPLLVGGLFIILGNVMPRSRPNWWFGIRTPWTLSNDRVWERTHRVGGYLFVAGGIVVMLAAVMPPTVARPIFLGTVIAVSVLSVAYSYIAWRQEMFQ